MTRTKTALFSAAALCLGATGGLAEDMRPAALLVAYYEGTTDAATDTAPLGRRAIAEAAPRVPAAFGRAPEPTLAGQVAPCWNAPDQRKLPPVTLALAIDDTGQPDARTIHLADAEASDEAALVEAFTRARDAILKCGGEDGYTMARADGAEIELIFAMGGVLQ